MQSKTRGENEIGFSPNISQKGKMKGHATVVRHEVEAVVRQQGGRTRSAAFYLLKV